MDRQRALGIPDAGMAAGARSCQMARLLGVGLTTLQRWRRRFAGDGDGTDGRKGSPRLVSHRLRDEEGQRIHLTFDQSEIAALPPGQIVSHREVPSPNSILADRGLYVVPTAKCIVEASPASPAAPPGAATRGQGAKSGRELGQQLPAHQPPWRLALPLPGDRHLEPQSGGLG